MKEQDNIALPTRDEIREKLQALICGDISPEDASNWASPWIVMDDPPVTDDKVWQALGQLCGADLLDIDGSYLHIVDDFKDWLKEFDTEIKQK